MKVKYIGDYYKVTLVNGKVYDVISIEDGFYRVKDEIDDALYSPLDFETIEDDGNTPRLTNVYVDE